MAAPGLPQMLNVVAPPHDPFSRPGATSDNLPAQTRPTLSHEPVIIPQRRPGSKERGFIRAYAPCLQEHGIDQEVFLHFLTECNQALQGSASVQAVRVAAGAVSLVPDPTGISNGVAAGIGLAAAAAAVLKSTSKTNTFLDRHNEEMFLPRGLFCVIVTHDPSETDRPESPESPPTPPKRQGSSHFSQQLGMPGWANKLKDPYRKSSAGLPPDVASLTFHEDDSAPGSTGEPPKNSGFKRFMGSMDNYLDNRALAQYTLKHDGDAIVKSQPKRAMFRNRYLDPTHPATTGGIAGMLSGGRVTDKGLDKLCSLSLIQRQIVAAAGQNTKAEKSFSTNSTDCVFDQDEADEKSRIETERKLGTQIASLSVVQEVMSRKKPKKAPKTFDKDIMYLSIVDLDSISQFTSRRGFDGGGSSGGEGLGDVLGTLLDEMSHGVVVI